MKAAQSKGGSFKTGNTVNTKGGFMQNYIKMAIITLVAFTFGVFVNTIAISNATDMNIAVVDFQKIVDSTSKAQAIKAEQKKKFEDLVAFVGSARTDIEAQKDPEKRKQLEEKYQNEFNQKKSVIDKDYEAKLASFNSEINSEITNISKEKDYDLVLLKSGVLSGGTDITDDVVKNLK